MKLPAIRKIRYGGLSESIQSQLAMRPMTCFCECNDTVDFYDTVYRGQVVACSSPQDSHWGHIAVLRRDRKAGWYVEFLDCQNGNMQGVGPMPQADAKKLYANLKKSIQSEEVG